MTSNTTNPARARCAVCSMTSKNELLVPAEDDHYAPIPHCGGISCREVVQRIIGYYNDVENRIPVEEMYTWRRD